MNSINKPIPPAQLWIGSHTHLCTKATHFLQKLFCQHGACQTCTTCRLIREHQYHGTIWLYPQKRYTLDQIAVIFDTIAFSLTPDQQLFFIIQKADFLTPACSNSLLKSVEEPPSGYHFIFLAEHKDLILPTIRSRCTIHTFQTESTEHEKEQLLNFFTNRSPNNPIEFSKVLEKIRPNEQESIELIDKLFIHWMHQEKKAIAEHNSKKVKTVTRVSRIISKALLKPPMPGSSMMFWKNLFLQLTNTNQ
ncbi:DNA polymerase III subunit delta' [Candidatus Dependentiae bacterium]|nr:MAG: DNA polymerase III subunit delta' [Candidatus Dependentiae bacterium]